MTLTLAIEVDGEREVGRRRVIVDLLLEQQGVRAQVYELLARDDATDDLWQVLVNERLAAGNRDHGRIAGVDRGQRVLDTHAFAQDLVRIIDLAAPRAFQIALEQRFQHQYERIAVLSRQLLA